MPHVRAERTGGRLGDVWGREDHLRPDRDDFFNRQRSASIDANTAAKRGRIGIDPTP